MSKSVTSTSASSSSSNELSPTKAVVGGGGELHQNAGDGDVRLTTNHGVVVSDNENSLRVGSVGPTLLEDYVLREKIFHFDHERIPERIVHARGSAAHGYFECTDPLTEFSSATVFASKGKRTPVFARFSTVVGGSGSADTPRDVRGFAVKFYTDEGNWDLVGNNIPVFFIQDAIKFPDLIHAVKMEADKGYPQAASAHDTFWDFVSLTPESTHMLMWIMSDRTIPRSLRMIDGFGVHTFRLVNDAGESRFVKFHWRPSLGKQSTTWDEAVKIAGADPDYHRRDLHDAIAAGDFPSWDLAVQVFDEEFAAQAPYSVFDATKLVAEEDVPLRIVGRMVLDRNPSNFFAETEQVAFLPTNIIPGIDFSDDPLLQGRLFSYLDTQHSRLGTTNFHQIPINTPKCPFANFQRDGHMQVTVPTGRANYEPNSLGENSEDPGPRADPRNGFSSFPATPTSGDTRTRARDTTFADHYSQARQFWVSQTPVEQGHIVSAFIFELSKVALDPVRLRTIANLANVDTGLAARVAAGLGVKAPAPSPTAAPVLKLDAAPSLSMLANHTPTLRGRKVGILISDGTQADAVERLRKKVQAKHGTVFVVAPRLNVRTVGGHVHVDGQLAGSPSVLFDAIAILVTDKAAKTMLTDSAAINFIADAYTHLKAIGHDGHATPLLNAARVQDDKSVTGLDAHFLTAASGRLYEREPLVVPVV